MFYSHFTTIDKQNYDDWMEAWRDVAQKRAQTADRKWKDVIRNREHFLKLRAAQRQKERDEQRKVDPSLPATITPTPEQSTDISANTVDFKVFLPGVEEFVQTKDAAPQDVMPDL